MPIPGVTHVPDFHPETPQPSVLPGPPPLVGGRLIVPLHWGKMWGVDFGIANAHPFAAVLVAWDREADVMYVLRTIKMAGEIPEAHVAAMLRINANAPVAWPHDGHNRDRGSGEALAGRYKELGLKMLAQHATWPQGGFSTEAAVTEMDQRMRTGRFRVCEDLHDWWHEYRLYHRENGLIVHAEDDLLSATQKVMMMRRYMVNGPIGYTPYVPPQRMEEGPGSTFDLFTGLPFE